jgi:hypothetical protein
MLSLEEVKNRLQDRNILIVSQNTGLHYNTVRAIKTGANDNPTYQVMTKLSDYLENKQSQE